ncbi:MAG: helix-turn-helix domain-containing protein, partial [Candidatus Enteromonas sp.]|nr:helix-turn-helix domain-containing protein [Candidatus Enteromonas sp.]
KIVQFLTENGPSSVTQIAEGLGVHNSTVSLSLKKLVRSGLVMDNGKKTRGKMFWLYRPNNE